MVGDHNVEASLFRLGHLGGSGDPAVDRQDEPTTFLRKPFERLPADAVALVEATR